jgi:flavin-dependent dehydrogenase
VPGLTSHLELQWRDTGYRRFVRSLSSFCRLVRFGKRGTGLSDPVAKPAGLDQRLDDLRAVISAARCRRLLLAAARDAGADVRLGVTARGVLGAGERVTGVRTSAGDQHARLVIGADGRHSVIARAVGADWTWLRPSATLGG